MVSEKMYDKLAQLAVRKGANVQKDQPVIINANVQDAAFVRKIVKHAYEAGARYVSVEWRDTEITRMGYEYETAEVLSEVPQWRYDKTKYQHDGGACYISVSSDKPGAMADVDGEKMHAANVAYFTKMADLMPYTMNNVGQWTVFGIPSVEWAKVVFPDLSDEEAFEKLGDAIFAVTRVTEDNDPVAVWSAHSDEMVRHADWLNRQGFCSLRYRSANGTDFTVGLIPEARWEGAAAVNCENSVRYVPNMPTEEVFTTPMAGRCEGILTATKPLSWNGQLIDGFSITFENGRAVSCRAEQGQDLLEQIIRMDETSCMLGEVALVPKESPVNQCGFLFYNTLFDENACCHVALGMGFKEVLPGGEAMTSEQAREKGINDSVIHVDFMVGSDDLSIVGIRPDGSETAVFVNGTWAQP